MKLRDLRNKTAGTAAWPARWVEGSDPSTVPDDGVLEGLTRLGGRLLLQIHADGQRRTASLEWDPPPGVGDVEIVLLASIGARIRDLSDLELPVRRGRASPGS